MVLKFDINSILFYEPMSILLKRYYSSKSKKKQIKKHHFEKKLIFASSREVPSFDIFIENIQNTLYYNDVSKMQ